jgi:murein DD-endopeptidase MepM/ murein hydrolase activator NlpD
MYWMMSRTHLCAGAACTVAAPSHIDPRMLEDSHRRANAGRLAAALALAALAGCTNYAAQPPQAASAARSAIIDTAGGPARHLVLPGETLSELAVHYRVPLRRMIEANRVRKPYHIYVGQVLLVPEPGMVALIGPPPARPRTVKPVMVAKAAPRPEADPPPAVRLVAVRSGTTAHVQDEATVEALRRAAALSPPPLTGDGFLWPVRGRILDGFGGKPSGARNDGINIAARPGTPVVAAEGGIVVYAAETIPGFGRMLLIRHADGFTTAYAHNRQLHVQVGDEVRRGQLVAEVGSTGNVTSPQLHFELRQGKKAIDPSRYLVEDQLRVASTALDGG